MRLYYDKREKRNTLDLERNIVISKTKERKGYISYMGLSFPKKGYRTGFDNGIFVVNNGTETLIKKLHLMMNVVKTMWKYL